MVVVGRRGQQVAALRIRIRSSDQRPENDDNEHDEREEEAEGAHGLGARRAPQPPPESGPGREHGIARGRDFHRRCARAHEYWIRGLSQA